MSACYGISASHSQYDGCRRCGDAMWRIMKVQIEDDVMMLMCARHSGWRCCARYTTHICHRCVFRSAKHKRWIHILNLLLRLVQFCSMLMELCILCEMREQRHCRTVLPEHIFCCCSGVQSETGRHSQCLSELDELQSGFEWNGQRLRLHFGRQWCQPQPVAGVDMPICLPRLYNACLEASIRQTHANNKGSIVQSSQAQTPPISRMCKVNEPEVGCSCHLRCPSNNLLTTSFHTTVHPRGKREILRFFGPYQTSWDIRDFFFVLRGALIDFSELWEFWDFFCPFFWAGPRSLEKSQTIWSLNSPWESR